MSLVKFATLCDKCGFRSEEYQIYPACRVCGDDICPGCEISGSYDEETNRADCKGCRVDQWVKHDVGCDWLWDPSQDCTCRCTEEDECDCEHNCRCCTDEDCPRHSKGAPYEH